jgi:solute carrier family 25 (mitochondrial dicarboxylate transporter), member 10
VGYDISSGIQYQELCASIERLTKNQLSASLLRQITYSTTRFGVYEKLKERSSERPSFGQLVLMSSTSGFLGGVAGNPADIINVRMQNDASLKPEQRRNYRHAIDGLVRMSREEGARVAFRGVLPNSLRAMLMTVSQLASYDSIKGALIRNTGLEDNLNTHFTASIAAGFIATTICSPVDVIKTRVMSAHEKESTISLLSRIYRTEGATWMFRGWVPSFIRLGPHTVATFIFLEQHKNIYRILNGVD